MKKIEWSEMKSLYDTDQVAFKYLTRSEKYIIFGFDREFHVTSEIPITSPVNSDQLDFETNYKPFVNIPFRSRIYTHTFMVTGSGPIIDISNNPMKYFTIQTKTTGTVLSWIIRLQVSIDNENWTTIATHTNAVGSGLLVFVTTPSPALYLRANCTGLDLGLGTNIIVKILGME